METRANYVLIGAFVLIASAALALFILYIAGTPLNKDYSTYDVVFEGPVNGLTEGGEVRFNGIKVGEVQTLKLDRADPNRVIARILIDARTPVRVDSIAQLNFLGITGVTFIQILAGSPDQPLLVSKDFQEPPVIRTERTALDELFQGGQDLLTVTGDTINRLNEALSEENVAHVNKILANVEAITDKLAKNGGAVDSATSALKSIDKAATAVASAGDTINGLAQGDAATLIANANDALKDLGPAIGDVRKSMANINGAVAQINSNLTPNANRALEQLSLAATDLSTLMAQLQSVLGQIEQNPSQFVYRQPQPVENK
jgi:phospholipid/cholesterol/gamma-HCH transport system substrate-binding protein